LTEKLVFFATDWGYTQGGINAFNIDLCSAVASLLVSGFEVVCVVPSATLEQVADARQKQVRLVGFATNAEERLHLNGPALSRLQEEFGAKDVAWWIGHDVVTGHWATDAHIHSGGSGQVALVHHMDYAAYKSLQVVDVEHAEQQIDLQNDLLLAVDVILTVGPRLLLSATEKVRGHNVEIKEIVPGLPRIEPLRSCDEGFRAIAMGRLEPQNNFVKQLKLAAHAFGAAIGHDSAFADKNPSLTVLGISNADLALQQHTLVAEVADKAGRVIPVHARPYEDDRQRLLETLRHHSALMMVSHTEAFGLVGWEAIGAAVPLIVSKKSGVYETVDRRFGGPGAGCLEVVDIRGSVDPPYYLPKDLEDVRDALCRIASNPTRAKESALSLREMIEQFYSWQKTAADFCSALKVGTVKTAESLNVDAIKSLNTAVNAAPRGDLQSQVLDGLKPPSRFRRFVILFGGISTALSDEEAFKRYSSWLQDNPNAELLICYEAGPSVIARARELDPENISTAANAGLPGDILARMQAKEASVKEFCERLSRRLEDRRDQSANRFQFVPVYEPVPTYVMVADDELFVTPLINKRSSETVSLILPKTRIQDRLALLRHVIYNLKKLEANELVSQALNHMSTLIETELRRG
jgi:glycosyltransferase involved in cell wall biosynthesis